jgi:hypothetical protein
VISNGFGAMPDYRLRFPVDDRLAHRRLRAGVAAQPQRHGRGCAGRRESKTVEVGAPGAGARRPRGGTRRKRSGGDVTLDGSRTTLTSTTRRCCSGRAPSSARSATSHDARRPRRRAHGDRLLRCA